MPQTSLTDRRGPEKVTATSLRPPLQLPPLHPRRGGDCLFDSRGASQLKSCERRAGEGEEAHPLGREVPLEKEMATHSSILAWNIPWMEERGRLQPTGSQRVGHN